MDKKVVKGHEYKIGDKVVPIKKTLGNDFENDVYWKRAKVKNQPYMYIVEIRDYMFVLYSEKDADGLGNWYAFDDIKPYIEEDKEEKVEDIKELGGYKIGDKVVPHSKSAYGDLDSCLHWKRVKDTNEPCLYVVGFDTIQEGKVLMINSDKDSLGHGNYYLTSDVKPYVEAPVREWFKVKAIREGYTDYKYKEGEIYTVFEAKGSYDEYYYYASEKQRADKCGWRKTSFELYKEEEVKMSNFKVGDFVVANAKGDDIYGVTGFDMYKAKVVKVVDADYIRIKVLAHKEKDYVGSVFKVNADYMKLYKPNKAKAKVEKEIPTVKKEEVKGDMVKVEVMIEKKLGITAIKIIDVANDVTGIGFALCCEADRKAGKFNEEFGQKLAKLRATKDLITKLEEKMINSL